MRVAILSWRDLAHPEGGGAERYAANVAAGLVRSGHQVTMFCAGHGAAPGSETVEGVRILRAGGRLSVYGHALRALRRTERDTGRFDVIVDVQNGLPFFSVAGTRTPVVVLVHHVHREQWPVVFGPAAARLGWFVESAVAPRAYRHRQYVAVSGRTKAELADLGVEADRIAVIHNGTDVPPPTRARTHAEPRLVVLGRLVPHKRVEHAVNVAARLKPEFPTLRLLVVGDGWWAGRIREHVRSLGAESFVDHVGRVDEQTKHEILASSWVALAPSVKEGWGLSVVEAASHGVPTVAYRGAGGLAESVDDGRTGLLADDEEGLVRCVRTLLVDTQSRHRLGRAAAEHAGRFRWDHTIQSWERLLRRTADGHPPVGGTDHPEVVTRRR